MTAMAPTRPAALPACRVRLTPGPTAAAGARGQIRHAMAGAVTADTRQARGEFRADVHHTAGKGRA
jgi:hypothetical protein